MSYILGIDYGEKYIGLALSDKNSRFSEPFSIKRNNKDFYIFLINILEKYNIVKIVIGNPVNIDGSEGFSSKRVRDFVQSLNLEIDCIFWNETLTSFEVENKKNVRIDDKSASIILQEYLDFINKV